MSKLKVTFIGFMFPLVLLFGSPDVASRHPDTKNNNNGYAQSGTLQRMIVENAIVTTQLYLNGLNRSNSLVAKPVTLHFAAAPNSFFPVLVFNDLLRGLQPGSMALALQNSSSAGVIPLRQGYGGQDAPGYSNLPVALRSSLKRLTVEKLP